MDNVPSTINLQKELSINLEIPDDLFLASGNKQASFNSPYNSKSVIGFTGFNQLNFQSSPFEKGLMITE